MSKQNVKLFYEALAKDIALQEKAQAIAKKYEGQKLDEKQAELIYQKELIPLARQAGYDFTPAELKEYASESKEPAMREISEEELATVAGGTTCVCVLYGQGNFQYPCYCGLYGQGMGAGYDCVCALGGGGNEK